MLTFGVKDTCGSGYEVHDPAPEGNRGGLGCGIELQKKLLRF